MLARATEVDISEPINVRRPVGSDRLVPAPRAPSATFLGSGTNSLIESNNSGIAASFKRGPAPLASNDLDSGKLETLDAVVRDIGQNFVCVIARPGGTGIEINVPLELCPSEILYEGTPISISIDKESKYSSLRIEKREKLKKLPEHMAARLKTVMDWADSL